MAKKSLSSPPEQRTIPIPKGRGKNWPADLEDFDAALADKHERLTRNSPQTVSAAQTAGGELCDSSQSEEEVQDQAATLEAKHIVIASIQAAQQRIREGTYGICEGCGANIPMARLDAIPETPVCIKCAQDSERGRVYRVLEPEFALAVELEEAEKEREKSATVAE